MDPTGDPWTLFDINASIADMNQKRNVPEPAPNAMEVHGNALMSCHMEQQIPIIIKPPKMRRKLLRSMIRVPKINPQVGMLDGRFGFTPLELAGDLTGPDTKIYFFTAVSTDGFETWAKWKYVHIPWREGNPSSKIFWEDGLMSQICDYVLLVMDDPEKQVVAFYYMMNRPDHLEIIGVLDDDDKFTHIVKRKFRRFAKEYWSKVSK